MLRREFVVAAITFSFVYKPTKVQAQDIKLPIVDVLGTKSVIFPPSYFRKISIQECCYILGVPWNPPIHILERAVQSIIKFLEDTRNDPFSTGEAVEQATYLLASFRKYRCQFFGYKNNKVAYVLCNFIYQDTEDIREGYWRETPMLFINGGKDYWRIRYVVDEGKCDEFSVNLDA